jgi:hypothetical protein
MSRQTMSIGPEAWSLRHICVWLPSYESMRPLRGLPAAPAPRSRKSPMTGSAIALGRPIIGAALGTRQSDQRTSLVL